MVSKNKDERERRNIDILGKRWRLAPYGQKLIDESSTRLFDIHAELLGFAALIRGFSESPEHDQFFGVGLSLQRLSRRIERISFKLNKAIVEINETPQTEKPGAQ